MLRNRLAEIMGTKRLKFSDVHKGTGVARTTLRAIYDNESKSISFDVLDTLLTFLEVTPSEFFDFLPASLLISFGDQRAEEEGEHTVYLGEFRLYVLPNLPAFTFVYALGVDSSNCLVGSIIAKDTAEVLKSTLGSFVDEVEDFVVDTVTKTIKSDYKLNFTSSNVGFILKPGIGENVEWFAKRVVLSNLIAIDTSSAHK